MSRHCSILATSLVIIAFDLVSWLCINRYMIAQDVPPHRFEAAIQTFEQQDLESPPEDGGVLFIGSSTVRRWDLKQSFPDQKYINRGFGGSEISDSIHFAHRIIIPYKPRLVVLYAGDNDLSRGKSAEKVTADFRTLVQTLHAALPNTRIVFIGIKPSIKRWNLIAAVRRANQRIQQLTTTDSRLEFVDVERPMIGDDAQPRKELFVADGLHLSPAGYSLWTSLLKTHLQDPPADLILKGGKIVTVNDQFAVVQAVAVRGDRIVAVGNDNDVMKWAGRETRTIDLRGKMVLPGLMDSHTHPTGASMHEFDHPVPDMQSIQDVLSYIKSRTEVVPQGEWIWVNQVFITRQTSSGIQPKRSSMRWRPSTPLCFLRDPMPRSTVSPCSLAGLIEALR